MTLIEQLEICIDFLCPFEDNITLLMLSNNILDSQTQLNTIETLESIRNTFNDLNKANTLATTIPELFRGKANKELSQNNCLVYIHEDASTDIIKFLTNNLDDEIETMLLDKYLRQVPQDKYLFNILNTPDDVVIDLVKNLDKNNTSYHYLMNYPYLSVWVLNLDEFMIIQDL